MKKFMLSIVLLASLAIAVLGPMFFGHALVVKDGKWFVAAGVALLIAAALFFVQKRLDHDEPVHH